MITVYSRQFNSKLIFGLKARSLACAIYTYTKCDNLHARTNEAVSKTACYVHSTIAFVSTKVGCIGAGSASGMTGEQTACFSRTPEARQTRSWRPSIPGRGQTVSADRRPVSIFRSESEQPGTDRPSEGAGSGHQGSHLADPKSSTRPGRARPPGFPQRRKRGIRRTGQTLRQCARRSFPTGPLNDGLFSRIRRRRRSVPARSGRPGAAGARAMLSTRPAPGRISPRRTARSPSRSLDQRHIVARAEDDAALQDRPRPIDRRRCVHRDVGTEFGRRGRLFLRRRRRIGRSRLGRGRRDHLFLQLVDAGAEFSRLRGRRTVDPFVELVDLGAPIRVQLLYALGELSKRGAQLVRGGDVRSNCRPSGATRPVHRGT